MTIKQKYKSIDQSKLPKSITKVLKGIKSRTKNFSDEEANDIYEPKLDTIIKGLKKKYPESVGEKKKSSPSKIESALADVKRIIKSDPVLKGFAGSDIQRDSTRKAKESGKRISKAGNVYYEYRENRIDRYAPEFPKGKPLLQKGGDLPKRYVPLFINDYIFDSDGNEVTFRGWGVFDTVKGMFTNISNDGEMKPYVPAGGFSTAKEIANWQNIGEIPSSVIYTVPHLRHRYNEFKEGGGLNDLPNLILNTKHKTQTT